VIPRYQRILFWTMVAGILLMTLFLLRGCQQAHKRLTAQADANANPIAPPTTSTTEDVTFYVASDADGSITTATRQLPLPQEPTLRARTLLNQLLADYTQPNSAHPLQPGPAIDDVFLLDLPTADSTTPSSPSTAKLAVVNLHAAFAANHPSGIEVEDLTLQSIIGTLHAAFPQLTQIRFVVDGQPQDTLAGHADLQRTYPATDTTFKPTPPATEPTTSK
jgi:hypothetical protein